MSDCEEIPYEEMWNRPNLFRRIAKSIRHCDPTRKDQEEGKLLLGFIGILLEIIL